MSKDRLEELLRAFPTLEVLAVGDFFLDRYLLIDPCLAEVSIETGLTAHQVVGRRLSPGAAGTVTSNLRALGAGTVRALGVIGDDGEGFELRRGLERTGVDTSLLVISPDRFTPTYTKPMLLQADSTEREIERQDIKNRTPLPRRIESEVIDRLLAAGEDADVVIVSDQVQERGFGVITDRVREEISRLAERKLVVADSRERIGEFGPAAVIKPNISEAARAIAGITSTSIASSSNMKTGQSTAVASGIREAYELGHRLAAGRTAPLFLTMGPEGILAIYHDAQGEITTRHVPAVPVDCEIDPVGAGDSCLAAISLALAAGSSPEEAAHLAMLAAAVTIRKLGQTGTASPDEVISIFERMG